MREVVLGTYAPPESAEALALDAACAQGGSLRLSFRRETFHFRARAYPEHVILTARTEGRLVGTLAVAAKPVELRGHAARATFAFDLRVHPAARGRGIARALAREGLLWAKGRSDLVYAYTMEENGAAGRLCGLMGLVDAGGYAYLACPAVSPPPPRLSLRPASYAEAHAAFTSTAGPFDLHADPGFQPGDHGYVASWLLRDGGDIAGCSCFSLRASLAEVVEAVPPPLRLVRALGDAGLPWPRRWPRVPRDGEVLRSWYVFDAFATRPSLGVELMRGVAAEARARGVDWCHLVHVGRDAWVSDVRAELPSLFAPLLRYRLLARRFDAREIGPLDRMHVDVRDL